MLFDICDNKMEFHRVNREMCKCFCAPALRIRSHVTTSLSLTIRATHILTIETHLQIYQLANVVSI